MSMNYELTLHCDFFTIDCLYRTRYFYWTIFKRTNL